MSDYNVQDFLGEISLDKYDGANRLITTHPDNLLGEIESRPTITTPSPSPQPPSPKELPEIEKLRLNALQDAAKIVQDAATIAQLRRRINELEDTSILAAT